MRFGIGIVIPVALNVVVAMVQNSTDTSSQHLRFAHLSPALQDVLFDQYLSTMAEIPAIYELRIIHGSK